MTKIDASPPDLILLDIMMPRVDGMEVARRVKGNASLPFIPIIMETALDSTQAKVEGLDSGADDYITKPIDFAELTARVTSTTADHGQRTAARDDANRRADGTRQPPSPREPHR